MNITFPFTKTGKKEEKEKEMMNFSAFSPRHSAIFERKNCKKWTPCWEWNNERCHVKERSVYCTIRMLKNSAMTPSLLGGMKQYLCALYDLQWTIEIKAFECFCSSHYYFCHCIRRSEAFSLSWFLHIKPKKRVEGTCKLVTNCVLWKAKLPRDAAAIPPESFMDCTDGRGNVSQCLAKFNF